MEEPRAHLDADPPSADIPSRNEPHGADDNESGGAGAGADDKAEQEQQKLKNDLEEIIRFKARQQASAALRCRNCCADCVPFLMFLAFTLAVVPAIVFTIASLGGTVLWATECENASNLSKAGLIQEGGGPNLKEMCSWYQWFKYVTGNLLGLATPLTNVSPVSGNVVSELFDLLISAWSLALSASCIAMVGALGFFTLFADRINKVADMRQETMKLHAKQDLLDAAELHKLDLQACKSFVRRRYPKPMPEVLIEKAFADVDGDGDRLIDEREVVEFLRQLEVYDRDLGPMLLLFDAQDLKLNALIAAMERVSGRHVEVQPYAELIRKHSSWEETTRW